MKIRSVAAAAFAVSVALLAPGTAHAAVTLSQGHADILDIDLLEAASAKVKANAARYPADEVRGSSAKRPR
jgi:hypothetical protein